MRGKRQAHPLSTIPHLPLGRATLPGTNAVEYPRIVSTDVNDFICKIWFPSLAHGA
jgi:hypothetical protein